MTSDSARLPSPTSASATNQSFPRCLHPVLTGASRDGRAVLLAHFIDEMTWASERQSPSSNSHLFDKENNHQTEKRRSKVQKTWESQVSA